MDDDDIDEEFHDLEAQLECIFSLLCFVNEIP
jgi:hypothetical protein